MSHQPRDPIRIAIVLDVEDVNPDLLLIFITARAVRLVQELQHKGIDTNLVRVDIDGYPHLSR